MKRNTLIACVAGGIVLVLLWYFLLFSPTSSDLNDTRDQVASVQSQNQQLENTIRRLKELSRNAPQQEATLRKLRAAVPANPDLGEFILQANDIASSAGIDWLSIAPTPPAATGSGGPESTIALSIQIDGGFFEVLDYLNRLEDLERLVLVDSINVSAAAEDNATGGTGSESSSSSGGAPDLSVTLTGRMFTSAAAPAPADGSGTITPTPTTPSTPGDSTSTTPPASTSGSSS